MEVINYPKYGAINVHGSLLPELRGGAPIHWAIIRGYKETGITIMTMSEKMDAGDIISQRKLTIEDDENLDSLYQRMSILGKDLLLETLPNIINNKATYTKQDETKVTFGFNIKKEEEKIDFSKTAKEIKNLVRGLSSIPGAYCYLDEKRLKIFEVEIIYNKKDNNYENGSIIDTEKMRIRYINASMSDPIILSPSPDGYRIKPLTSNASLIGILEVGDVTVAEKRLFRGDTILMATDGVSEVMDDSGVELGDTDIYKKTLMAGAAKEPQAMVDDIVDLIMKYNGDKKLHDDVTMMIAKVGY